MRFNSSNHAFRTINLADCPLGRVFDVREKDAHIEKTFFAGWTDGFCSPVWPRQSSIWRVILEEDGEKTLEYPIKGEAVLTTGDFDWSDYVFVADVRQMQSSSCNTPDDEYQAVARTGLLFRYRDMRQHYFFCLEGLTRVVL